MAEAGGDKSLPERIRDKVEEVLPGNSAKKEKAPKQPKGPKEPKAAAVSKPPKAANLIPAGPVDPDAMFKQGFLAEVRSLRPEGEKVFTRFPPEPNGYLHIGHSKAITVNFGFAKFHGGECYLRFDDTNPEAEEEKYFTAIEEIVTWLGFKPYQITYSSDNFDKLYELAEKLIEKDGAYVCYCTAEEMNDQRGGTDPKNKKPRYACKHRDRPIAESISEFRAMRDGKYKPREAFLRMKMDLTDGNPQMWDLAAYRILDKPHHRTGSKWRIYPTYDFTHCLCDSFEGITHSLCTTEFMQSRVSYDWLVDEVEVYKPMQREYGRLNLTGTIMSKRKIARLVNENVVAGWDDPRLYTLVALRRRGIPPGAILAFVSELGVTTATTDIQITRFEQSVRRYLETSVPRLMVILDPIKIIIDDLPDNHYEEFENGFGPKDKDMGNHTIPFTKTVYIDRDDFREVDSADFFRMAPGKPVGLLKVPYPVIAKTFTKDETTGLVTVVHASYDVPAEGEKFKKPKAYIQWIADAPSANSPIKAEARVFNPLFKSERPDSVKPDFMADLTEDSLTVYPNAMVEVGLTEIRRRAPWPEEAGEQSMTTGEVLCGEGEAVGNKVPGFETVRFQGMRVGYFCLDKDTTTDKIILNRIVSLKEDVGKDVGKGAAGAGAPKEPAARGAKAAAKAAKASKKEAVTPKVTTEAVADANAENKTS